MVQQVKNLPAMQETQDTWVLSLGWDNLLEKGNGYAFHYSCLQNSINRGAWYATGYGVTKSRA